MALRSIAGWRTGFALFTTFVLVHAGYWLAGVRFDSASLDTFMQYLDPELLRTRLLESLLYLHIQPPLFNLFIGLALKVDPGKAWAFQSVFLCSGLVLYVSSFLLQRRLGVRTAIAYVLSSLFLASPGFILWEHFLLYEFPCAALLALSAVLLFDVLERGGRTALWAFLGSLFLIGGLRSLFHFGWLIAMCGLLLALRPAWWRRTLPAALTVVVLLGAFYAKNYVLFGEFTACTFVPKNLWIMTVGNIGWDQKQAMVDEGQLSRLSLINRWSDLAAYPAEYAQVPEQFRKIAVLANPKKSSGGENYNHYGFIAIAKVYGRDAMQVMIAKPWAYPAALALSSYRYFAPTSSPPISPQNKSAMAAALWFYDHILMLKTPDCLRTRIPFLYRAGVSPYVTLHAGLPAVVLFGLCLLACSFRRALGERRWASLSIRDWVLAFLLLHIVMVAVLGCALDFHETMRYRFLTNAFSLALTGLALEQACAWYRTARAARNALPW